MKTKLLVNLAQPELSESAASSYVDGIGLLRAEFIATQINEHPCYMIEQGRGQEYVVRLATGLTVFASAFYPRQVVYRTNNFQTNEYRALKGGEKYEEIEENPMLGYRGAARYIHDVETFKLELAAIRRVREKYNNVWVVIPFVRTVQELVEVKAIMDAEGLERSRDFKIWLMVEVPSNVFLLEKFVAVGIDGISIDLNDLTQLILGADRDSVKVTETVNEENEAVMLCLEKTIKMCSSIGITSSICGMAPSVHPKLIEKLVEWGITSISVNTGMVDVTHEIIIKTEARLEKNI